MPCCLDCCPLTLLRVPVGKPRTSRQQNPAQLPQEHSHLLAHVCQDSAGLHSVRPYPLHHQDSTVQLYVEHSPPQVRSQHCVVRCPQTGHNQNRSHKNIVCDTLPS
jgi:hypothetical protein